MNLIVVPGKGPQDPRPGIQPDFTVAWIPDSGFAASGMTDGPVSGMTMAY